jgi:hypothetical protein
VACECGAVDDTSPGVVNVDFGADLNLSER